MPLRAISNVVTFMLVFVFTWTVYLKEDAQVGQFEGKPYVVLETMIQFNRFSIQGKAPGGRTKYYIPHSSIASAKRGRPVKVEKAEAKEAKVREPIKRIIHCGGGKFRTEWY